MDFPDDVSARAWNAFYTSQHGVESSSIARLLDDEDLVRVSEAVASSAARLDGQHPQRRQSDHAGGAAG